ncbi:hypothetical protein [Pelagibaculum spongiae]|uniref:Uncharacterized protein n=1 Tax=Pelagibaculum spongiae TaxID=2080658 RepID=A0A2V1GWE2_9GAMM|nr:hypothetical protein [Pelagibaculum spongiae]PVZ65410.1 hypothetical protein DC094_18180 [Pelagibaculum spongiae]
MLYLFFDIDETLCLGSHPILLDEIHGLRSALLHKIKIPQACREHPPIGFEKAEEIMIFYLDLHSQLFKLCKENADFFKVYFITSGRGNKAEFFIPIFNFAFKTQGFFTHQNFIGESEIRNDFEKKPIDEQRAYSQITKDETIFKIMRTLGLSPQQCLLIDDSETQRTAANKKLIPTLDPTTSDYVTEIERILSFTPNVGYESEV